MFKVKKRGIDIMQPSDNSAPTSTPVPEQPKKPGFFARLFGKKSSDPVIVPAQHESQTPPPQLDEVPSVDAPAGLAASVVNPVATDPVSPVVPTVDPIVPATPVTPVVDSFAPVSPVAPSFDTPSATPVTPANPVVSADPAAPVAPTDPNAPKL